MPELNTFSIVARCPRTGMLGVAVSTAVPAVGAICPYIEPSVGAVSTQSWVNPYLAVDGPSPDALGHFWSGSARAGDRGGPRPRRASNRRGRCRRSRGGPYRRGLYGLVRPDRADRY